MPLQKYCLNESLLLKALGFYLMLFFPVNSPGHEAWVEPVNYQQEHNPTLKADIRVGQMFKGHAQIYNGDKFVVLDIARGRSREKISGRLGDLPAIVHTLTTPGLYTIGYQSTGSTISYSNWQKFSSFVRQEGLEWVIAEHRSRGFPEQDFDEVFYRYAKSIVSWRSSQGNDVILGLPFEIVLLNNPYNNSANITVEVIWDSKPHPNAQLAVFQKSMEGAVVRTDYKTDALGRVDIQIAAGHQYLLSTVHMEPRKSDADKALWNSHWASITFEVPKVD